MAVTFPVAVVVRAVDKLTAPMRLMRREISRVLKPIDEMRGKFKRFGDAAGLPKLMKGVSGLSSALGGLWQSAKQSVFWIGGIAVAATAAGFALVKSFAGAAEEIQNTAQKLGVGVEVLQGWRHAANLNHIENEALEKGVLSLARAFDKARHGGKAQLELFRRIGISEEQLRTFKSLEQLLPAVADGLGGVRNATARAAIVQGLFSKVGAQLIPMLMAGSAGLAEMTAEARKLGIVLDASTIKAAAELDDEIDRLEASFLGVRNAIASQLVPELLPLIKRFREWITENLPRIRALARAIADRLPGAIESVTKAFAKLWGQSKPVRDVLGQLFELLGPLGVAIVVVAGILINGRGARDALGGTRVDAGGLGRARARRTRGGTRRGHGRRDLPLPALGRGEEALPEGRRDHRVAREGLARAAHAEAQGGRRADRVRREPPARVPRAARDDLVARRRRDQERVRRRVGLDRGALQRRRGVRRGQGRAGHVDPARLAQEQARARRDRAAGATHYQQRGAVARGDRREVRGGRARRLQQSPARRARHADAAERRRPRPQSRLPEHRPVTWIDDLQPASFRGVPFRVQAHDTDQGRKVVVHEYPGRDIGWAQDLGKRATAFRIEAYVLGDDVAAQRDRLLEALGRAGAGELVHPYLGSFQVVSVRVNVNNRIEEGRLCRLQLEFVEAGKQVAPGGSTDPKSASARASNAVMAAAGEEFSGDLTLGARPGVAQEAAASSWDRASQQLATVDLRGTTARVAAWRDKLIDLQQGSLEGMRDPPGFAGDLKDLIQTLAQAIGSPETTFLFLLQLARSENGRARPLLAGGAAADRGDLALSRLLARQAVAEAGRQSVLIGFETYEDAVAARTAILLVLDELEAEAGDDVYREFGGLRDSLVSSLPPEDNDLPRLSTIVLPRAQPSLTLAYRLYGSVERESDIVNRNRASNPAFLRAGVPLQVLIDPA
jgi:hypothetical protein